MKNTAIAFAGFCAISIVFAAAQAAEVARPVGGGAISTAPPDAASAPPPRAETLDVARTRVDVAKARPDGHRIEPPHGRVCFNASETREKIATHRLAEPFRALRAGRLQGEALRAKLCRWKPDEFIYEVAVLRRDGRIAHVYMNAQNGQSVGAPNDPDHN